MITFEHVYTHTHTHTHCSNYPPLLPPCLPPSQCLMTSTLAAVAAVYPSPRDSPPPPLKATPTLVSHLRQRNSRVELTRTRIRLSSRTCRIRGWCRGSQPGGNRYQAFRNFHRQISNLCHNQVPFQASQARCLEWGMRIQIY